MNWRWPNWRELRIGVPVAVPCLVLAVFVLRGCDTAEVPLVQPRTDVTLPQAPATSAPLDLTAVQLAPVNGTTVPHEVRAAGTAHLNGTVAGPQGPVAGAVVRVEHLVSRQPPVIDVASGPDGTWDLPNIAGGAYRVRAFLAPSLAQVEPEVFFINDGQQQTLNLTMSTFNGMSIVPAVAPDPPELNRPATVALRVVRRSVNQEGVVTADPIANASVALTGTPGWSVSGPSTATSSAEGDATFTLVCKSVGASQLQVVVRSTPSDAAQPVTVTVSACTDPSATTTTTTPGSSGPPTTASAPPPN
jgi:hypothetical protein